MKNTYIKFFFGKKERKKDNKNPTTQEPLLLTEEVKHIAPTDILGISSMGKAMESWNEW